jgi:hypothetical protein
VAPTPAPSGSGLRLTLMIRTAIALKIDVFTPTACSTSMIRTICASTPSTRV